jgi:putative peptide zinc metalloprotease protein
LQRRRVRAIRTSLALAGGVLFLAFALPVPLHTHAQGVVWLPEQSILRAGGNGFFQRWLVAPGQRVHKGQPLFVLEDPLLSAELEVQRAKVDEAEAQHRAEQFSNPLKAAVLQQQLEYEQAVLARVEERAARMVGYAADDGLLVAQQPQDMPQRYMKKGELVGHVLEKEDLIVRVVVPQDDIDLVRTRYRSAELRLADWIAQIHPATLVRQTAGGVEELPTAALGSQGGGAIAVLPNDPDGIKTLERVFTLDLALPAQLPNAAFGERAYVRFAHGYEPLAWQGLRRLRQLFLSRFGV